MRCIFYKFIVSQISINYADERSLITLDTATLKYCPRAGQGGGPACDEEADRTSDVRNYTEHLRTGKTVVPQLFGQVHPDTKRTSYRESSEPQKHHIV